MTKKIINILLICLLLMPTTAFADDNIVSNVSDTNIEIENEFDNGLTNYIPNKESKCPKCGRELLGTPSICPYCKNNLR